MTAESVKVKHLNQTQTDSSIARLSRGVLLAFSTMVSASTPRFSPS